MVIKKNYKKHIKFIAAMTLSIIIALIVVSIHRVYAGSIKELDYNRKDLVVLFNRTADEQDLSMLLDGYEHSAEIIEHFSDYALVSTSNSQVSEEVIAHLDKQPLVKIVEPIAPIKLMQTTNDTYSSAQWAINNPGYYSVYIADQVKEYSSTQDVDMDIAEAWINMNQEEIEFKKVVVAIIDTGVDYTHPDLEDHIWENKNEIPDDGIDNDNNGYVDDIYGWDFYNDDSSVCHYKFDQETNVNISLPEDNDDHGTHIAGIIGAVSDNKIGIAGIASNIDIELMILKINGGPDGTGSISDAILAIKYATMMGADICNISWGTSQYSSALKEVIRESDMLFVAAAGNLGSNNDDKPVYPASYDLGNLISVTFVDANGRLNKLSNYGKESVDIAAPGTDIMSTVVGAYKAYSGSSMAAPHVSGVASLIYSYNEGIYPAAVKALILNTLKPISKLEGQMLYPGIPNANNALLELPRIEPDLLAPIIELKTIYNKGEFAVPISLEDQGGSDIRVIRWLSGKREMGDFNRGTSGLVAESNQLNVSKAGVYTVYTSDYAGNESIQYHEVTEDIKPPTISANYIIAEDYKKRTINLKVLDTHSGVKRVKYLPGNKNFSDFLPAGSGTEIILKKGRGTFSVKKDGTYTIYAIDNRGNQIVKPIEIKTILSDEIKFTRSDMAMSVGQKYNLRAFVKPANTTDVISYTSSNDRIALVNKSGKIVALREGRVTITATTNNGHKVVCRIIVHKRYSQT